MSERNPPIPEQEGLDLDLPKQQTPEELASELSALANSVREAAEKQRYRTETREMLDSVSDEPLSVHQQLGNVPFDPSTQAAIQEATHDAPGRAGMQRSWQRYLGVEQGPEEPEEQAG